MKDIQIYYEHYISEPDPVTGMHIAIAKVIKPEHVEYLKDTCQFHLTADNSFVVYGHSFIYPRPTIDRVYLRGVPTKESGVMEIDSILDTQLIEGLKLNPLEFLASNFCSSMTAYEVQSLSQRLGNQFFKLLDTDPEQLLQYGLKTTAAQLRRDWKLVKNHTLDFGLLKGLGATPEQIADFLRVAQTKGLNVRHILSHNPYALSRFVPLETLDAYALRVVPDREHPARISALTTEMISQSLEQGGTFVPISELFNRLHAVNVDISLEKLEQLKLPGYINNQGSFYRDDIARLEYDVARKLSHHIAHTTVLSYENISPDEDFLDKDQQTAVANSLKYPLSIITGGPGSGKSTVTASICHCIEKAMGGKAKLVLIAPTAQAAQRLHEATGYHCITLHAALGASEEAGFLQSSGKQLDADLVLIDEASMLDLYMVRALLTKLTPRTRTVLLGDEDQLESVEPGNVLHDLIDSRRIPVTVLKGEHRFGKHLDISNNAKLIKRGLVPDLSPNPAGNWHFVPETRDEFMVKKIKAVISDVIEAKYQIPLSKIQILSPQYETLVGVDNLNQELGPIFNPDGFTATFNVRGGAPRSFRVGDRVTYLTRDKSLKLINGSIGVVEKIDLKEHRELVVNFAKEGVKHVPISKVHNMRVSFANSVHKAQGSEYDVVIIPISKSNRRMLHRNLLYTGITRAKKHVFLVGDATALEYALAPENQPHRETNLSHYIQKLLPEREITDTPELS